MARSGRTLLVSRSGESSTGSRPASRFRPRSACMTACIVAARSGGAARRRAQSPLGGGRGWRPPRAELVRRRRGKPLAAGTRWLFRVRRREVGARCTRYEPHRDPARFVASRGAASPTRRTPVVPERAAQKTGTRPPRKSRIEYRAEARVRDPLLADRFTAWPVMYGLTEDEVDLLTADRPIGDLFEEAVGAGAPRRRHGPLGYQ